MVRITEILTDGKKPSPKAEAKPKAKRSRKKPAAEDSAAAQPERGAAPAA